LIFGIDDIIIFSLVESRNNLFIIATKARRHRDSQLSWIYTVVPCDPAIRGYLCLSGMNQFKTQNLKFKI